MPLICESKDTAHKAACFTFITDYRMLLHYNTAEQSIAQKKHTPTRAHTHRIDLIQC